MRISDLLRWGPRKEFPGAKPKARRERRNSVRRRVEGPSRLCWTSDSGEVVFAEGMFTDAGDEGVGAQVDREVPVNRGVWFVFDEEQPWPATIRHCEEGEDGYHVGAFIEAASAVAGIGSIELLWFDSDARLQSGAANVRSGEEGKLELNSGADAPVGSILLVRSAEVCCLAVSTRSEPRGDRFFVEVEVLTDSVPRSSQIAA